MPAVALPKRALFLLALCAALAACSPRDGGDASRAQTDASQTGRASPGVGRRATDLPDFTALIQEQGPAVVNVVTSREMESGLSAPFGMLPDDPFFDFFRRFMPPPGEDGREVQGIGSGFIISEDGLILTNAHVVADATSVTIRLADEKREFEGKVLGTDRRTDIAVVKIEANGLPVARLGDSSTVRPGQWVAAIGSPFGFANTITAGIVSATERALPDESFVPFIQTDVPINPGNSGGPLLNVAGEVVGINSMIYSGTGGYMGVSFAIPIELALDVARQLREHGKVTRGRLGVVIQQMTPELAQAFKMREPRGVLVGAVEPGSPADEAGLKSGDVILTYNGTPVETSDELPRLVAATKPGTDAKLEIWRNGQQQTVTVEVGEFAADPSPQAAAPEQMAANRLGLVLRELPPIQLRQIGIDYGLLVESVGGPAANTPIRPGDIVVAINEQRFANREAFEKLLSRVKPGDTVALLLRRGDASVYVPIKVPS